MGAWGTRNFENDSALDWLGELTEELNPALVEETMVSILEENDNPESDECCYALAAAEIVAMWNGNKSEDYPEEGMEAIESLKVSNLEELKDFAVAAIQKIRTDSELKELWMESDGLAEWSSILDDLIERLK